MKKSMEKDINNMKCKVCDENYTCENHMKEWTKIREWMLINNHFDDFNIQFHQYDNGHRDFMYVISKTYKKFAEYQDELEKVLINLNFEGEVIIDKLSYTHNHDRFIRVQFVDKEFKWYTARQIDGSESMRFETTRYFYRNQKLLENTLLTKEEKRKIRQLRVI